MKNDWQDVISFLEREQPDVFLVQEARLPAAEFNRGQVKRSSKAAKDYELVQRSLVSTDRAAAALPDGAPLGRVCGVGLRF